MKIKPKVIFITSVNFGYCISGLTRIIDFSEYLKKNGYNVSVLVSTNKKFKDKRPYIKTVSLIDTKQSPESIRGLYDRFSSMLNCSKKLLKIITKEKANIVICQDLQLMYSLLSIKKKANFHLIFDFGDPIGKRMKANGSGSILSTAANMYEQYVCEAVNSIIVTMEQFKPFLQDRGISESKITTIPYGVNLNLFKNIKPKRLTKKKIIFTYIGHLGTWFDIPEFIHRSAPFLRKHSNVLFRFIGPGYLNYIKEIKYAITSENLEKSFEILPPIKKKDVPKWLSKTDFGLTIVKDDIKSFGDSVPSKTLDYMAAGKPILAYGPRGSIYDSSVFEKFILDNKIGGFVTSWEDFEQTCAYMVYHRKELAKNCKQVVKSFDFQLSAKKLKTLLDGIVI